MPQLQFMGAPQDHDSTLLRAGGLPPVVIGTGRSSAILRSRAGKTLPGARREPHPFCGHAARVHYARGAGARGQQVPGIRIAVHNIPAFGNGARFTSFSLAELLKEYQFLREILLESCTRKRTRPG
jgi:hypothetical protein